MGKVDTLKEILTNIDMSPNKYKPKINGNKAQKSIIFGCISAIFWFFLIIFIISQLYISFSRNFLQAVASKIEGDMQIDNISYYMTFSVNPYCYVENQPFFIIDYDHQHEYGLNLTVRQGVDEHGIKKLANSYYLSGDFVGFRLQNSPPLSVNGQTAKYFQVAVQTCNKQVDPSCVPIQKSPCKQIKLVVFGDWLAPNFQTREDNHFYQETKGFTYDYIVYSSDVKILQGRKVSNYFGKFHGRVSSTIFPEFQVAVLNLLGINPYSDTWYHDGADLERQFVRQYDEASCLHIFSFYPSGSTLTVDMKNQAIDLVSAKVLGLISLFTLIIGILPLGYKEWCVQIEIARQLNKKKWQRIANPTIRIYFHWILSIFFKKKYNFDTTVQKLKQTDQSIDLVQMRKELNKVLKKTKKLSQKTQKLRQKTDILQKQNQMLKNVLRKHSFQIEDVYQSYPMKEPSSESGDNISEQEKNRGEFRGVSLNDSLLRED